jgi:hypothetical protein
MLGILDFKMTFYDLDLNKDLSAPKTDVYYTVSGDHKARNKKTFDIILSRYENNLRTHIIPLYLDIANPNYIFSCLEKFRSQPAYYFFNITNLFTRSDFNQEDIQNHFSNGIPIFNDSKQELFKIKF